MVNTLQVVKTFEESDKIMKNSSKPVVRLQANLDAHRDHQLTEISLRNFIENIRVFHEMAQKCEEDVLFLLVTGGTLCYWTFFSRGRWDHLNSYQGLHPFVQVEAPEDCIRRYREDGQRKSSEIWEIVELFENALETEE